MRRRLFTALLALGLVLILTAAFAGGCGKAPKPAITDLTPSSAVAGAVVNVVGSDFGDSQGNSVVHVGPKVADVTSWTNALITFKVPTGLDGTMEPVSVLTGSGESNELMVQVLVPSRQDIPATPPQPSGQIESITPVLAMQSYEKKKNVSTVGWTYGVVKLSGLNPKWKIDQGGKTKGTQTYFLLQNNPTAKVDPNWSVIDAATSFTPQKLATDGAPADLQVTLPTPTPPQPPAKTQQQVILDYLTAKGIDTTAVTITLVNESKTDPTWELFNCDWPPEAQIPDVRVVLHQENGQWVVKGSGATIPSIPGMPPDLLK